MGLLTTLGLATTESESTATDETGDIARCRGCGRYYELTRQTCPHCDSGNKIRSGAPNGQTRK